MAYVRYKLSEESHDLLKKVCSRLGMKESEVSRIALMEYMRSIGILSDKVRRIGLVDKFKDHKEHRHGQLLTKLIKEKV
jgi:hypothetical protein